MSYFSYGIAGVANVTVTIQPSLEEIMEARKLANESRNKGRPQAFNDVLKIHTMKEAVKRYAEDGATHVVMYPRVTRIGAK